MRTMLKDRRRMDAALLSCGELIRRKPNPTYCELIGLPATSVLLLSKNTPVVQKYDLCAKRRDGTFFHIHSPYIWATPAALVPPSPRFPSSITHQDHTLSVL